MGGGRLGREEELKCNTLDTRSCLACGTNHISLSLPGGRENSVASMHTQHFHRENQMQVWKAGREERQGLQEGRLKLSRDKAGKEAGLLDHHWLPYLQSYPRNYDYIWRCTQGMKGKRERFLNWWGISLKEAMLCS